MYKSCWLAQIYIFLFPAGDIAPSSLLLYFLGSFDSEAWYFRVPWMALFPWIRCPKLLSVYYRLVQVCLRGSRIKWMFLSPWLEEHVSKCLLVQLGRADATCFWCMLCNPFLYHAVSLFPEVTHTYSFPCNLYPTVDQPEPRSRGVVHRRVENSRASQMAKKSYFKHISTFLQLYTFHLYN